MADDQESPVDRPDGAPSSVLRPRLAWAPVEDCPDLEDLGLESAKEAGFAWQSHRGYADWNELVWVTEDPDASEWVGEIHGLFGIGAELVLTSIEAAAEIEITRRALQESASMPLRAAQWRTLRFFAEGQGNNLTVFGHAVANLTIRTLALHGSFTVAGIGGLRTEVFHPKSTDRHAWASLTPQLAGEVVASAAMLKSEARALANALSELASGPWSNLWELRGQQYHRWRGESPGVSAVNFNAVTLAERLRRREVIGFGGHAAAYVEGEQVVNDIVGVADKTLRQVVDWMPRYLDTWAEAFGAARSSPADAAS